MGNWATEIIEALATAQHGIVARAQLIERGLAPGLIAYRLARGDLIPIPGWRGVYAVGHRALTREAQLMAATLACQAHLSHEAAAELWAIRGRAPRLEATRDTRGRRLASGLIIHASPLHEEDRTLYRRIPVTSIPRTLADISNRLTTEQLERAVTAAERRQLLDWGAMDRLLARRIQGTAALREVLGRADPRAVEACEGLEELFLSLWTDRGLPEPALQALVAGHRVDFLWELAKVIVECDGYRYHSGRLKHDEDRIRDMHLRAAGYEVHRATHRILTEHPDQFIETVHRSIVRRSRQLAAARGVVSTRH